MFLGQALEEELVKSKNHWLVMFFSNWSDKCRHFSPIFDKLSKDIANESLKFGKLDASRYPIAAKRFNVHSCSMKANLLPTLILFGPSGIELIREPNFQNNHGFFAGIFDKYNFTLSESNIIERFQLTGLIKTYVGTVSPNGNLINKKNL